MASYKTTGIVLKTRKLGEADRIIILYTATRGRVEAVAKGIRRTKSKFGARLEPFTESNLFLHTGRNLDIISQVELVRANHFIREDLNKLSYGWAILNLMETVVYPGEADSRFFHLLRNTLKAIDQDQTPPDLALLKFSLRLSNIVGYQPNFISCFKCGRKYSKGPAHFSYIQGGLICRKCLGNYQNIFLIPEQGISFLNKYSEQENNIDLSQGSDNLSAETIGCLLQLVHQYLKYHLHADLKSWSFIGNGNINKGR